jgi:hypothetical protein
MAVKSFPLPFEKKSIAFSWLAMGAGAVAPFIIESKSAAYSLFFNAAYFLVMGMIALWGAGVWSAMEAQLKTLMGRRLASKTPTEGTGE